MSKQLPQYQCHKKVRAAKITHITFQATGGGIIKFADTDGIEPIKVGTSYMDKHRPQIGGWFVQYEDGYESYSPNKSFEEGYALVSP